MPPKAATNKGVAPKGGVTKKTAAATTAATKKAAAAKKTEKPASKPATKKAAATNGATAASKKRKLEEDEEPEEESAAESADDSKLSNAKTTKPTKKAAAPKKTAAAAKKAAETDDESKTKKAAPKKAAPKKEDTKKTAAPKAKAGPAAKKRKVSDDETEDEKPAAKKPTAKKAKEAESTEVDSQATESAKSDEETEVVKPVKATKKTATAAPKPHPHKIGAKINSAPTQILDIYVFGEGSSGELGLGSKHKPKKVTDVKRPRLNPFLDAKDVGVVQIACGGMHAAAITKDNKILTWGVNDQGALGRETNWEGGVRDVDDEEDDENDEDSGVNPRESTPTAVDSIHFAPEAKFTQVVASDSATFALTEDGRVYGWGTFRSSDGILGFTEKMSIQMTPMFITSLKNITALAAGSNHILALDNKGTVLAWGCGQQNQLGRRVIERNKLASLVPQSMGLPKNRINRIACGSYHSFAMDRDGVVWAWGLNNFAETGISSGAGEDDAVILRPTIVESLKDYKIKHIAGGEHHSLACTEKGQLLTWGRLDGHQVGIPVEELDAEHVIKDESQNPRILSKPTVVEDVANCVFVAAGVDNNIAVDSKGVAHSWGFSANYQTGQGTTDDIETPTTIDNSAVKDKKIIFAGAGGQYSVLGGVADVPKTNGMVFTSNGQPATGGFRPVF
ncbi:ran exchange factor prp20 pim1 [Colletotrichum kahawae]|uniref:Ran exchange factor prp20 pim1 n=1 Tax=Colletotrichum kahawae TaxID=34407 RepID=A0AAD9Y4E9_COLKA|nr:ran exchange factor prp20 pim1 [Colletotrichum kahawae]